MNWQISIPVELERTMLRQLIVFSLLTMAVPLCGQEKKAQPMVKRIELIFMETKKVEGVTRNEGFQSGDGGSIAYLHKKPALHLTPAHIKSVELSNIDLSRNGLNANNYSIKIQLTDKAKKELAAQVKGKKMKLLTLLIDGKRWGGMWRYEVDETKKGVPPQCRASSFSPTIGYFSSRAYAESIADALR